tara:strand:+ start:1714 stop:2682 length:969 start_codon:yes stop_codon:yes gene_type:complete
VTRVDARPVPIDLADAIDLGHAWMQGIAERNGIRVLLLKGPTLARQGVRPAHASGDVDVLVSPDRFEAFLALIEKAGWQEFPDTFASARFTLHSRTLRHPDWPHSTDVHRYFPGFLADPLTVFDLLWHRRAEEAFAHRVCQVPDAAANRLITALHALRGGPQNPRHQRDLAHLRQSPLTGTQRDDLVFLAHATGCAVTLETELRAWGVDIVPSAQERSAPGLDDWRDKVRGAQTPALLWWTAWRRARGLDRLRVMWRAIWPSREDMLRHRPGVRDRWADIMLARVRRWGRSARSLSRALGWAVSHPSIDGRQPSREQVAEER